ncbi:MAG: toll/interleukin-1 receptor domain-containing protein, partial [Candidatus Magnetomorum sp.]|nr:toll/interleukin-1 receptor domain-containing protein [Candidatus Magnetomorum sp.]
MKTTPKKPDVFISYSRKYKHMAERICNDLKQEGITTWMDTNDIQGGQLWEEKIKKAIQDSDYFLILLASDVLATNGYIHTELKFALDHSRCIPQTKPFIIPVRLDNCNLDGFGLDKIQWVDAFDDYPAALKKLLAIFKPTRSLKRIPPSINQPHCPKKHAEKSSLLHWIMPILLFIAIIFCGILVWNHTTPPKPPTIDPVQYQMIQKQMEQKRIRINTLLKEIQALLKNRPSENVIQIDHHKLSMALNFKHYHSAVSSGAKTLYAVIAKQIIVGMGDTINLVDRNYFDDILEELKRGVELNTEIRPALIFPQY